jgi:hypothetical protein
MDQVRVGYLADQYPATSHTFILREVLALRALGIDIATFSTRRAGEEHILSADDERAFASTFAVLPIAPLALAASHLRALLTAPRAYLRTLVSAVGMGRAAASGSSSTSPRRSSSGPSAAARGSGTCTLTSLGRPPTPLSSCGGSA